MLLIRRAAARFSNREIKLSCLTVVSEYRAVLENCLADDRHTPARRDSEPSCAMMTIVRAADLAHLLIPRIFRKVDSEVIILLCLNSEITTSLIDLQ